MAIVSTIGMRAFHGLSHHVRGWVPGLVMQTVPTAASPSLGWSPPETGTSARAQQRRGVQCLAHCQQVKAASTTTEAANNLIASLEAELGTFSTEPQHVDRSIVIVISGPSGVGKDAAIKRLQEVRPDIHFVVTATSRPMRPGEVEGVDYLFVDKPKFKEWIEAGEMLEHALVYGQYKGIPKSQVQGVLAQGKDVVLRLDVQGAATIRKLIPDCISIFIVAENERSLVERLVARSTELPDQLKTRVQTAREEAACVKDFGYVVVNESGQLDETVARLGSIIDAEKSRVRSNP